MREVPFDGRLDVALACLLAIERHRSAANSAVARGRLARDVLALVEWIEVPPECLEDLSAFRGEVDRALRRLVHAGWVQARTVEGVTSFHPRDATDGVIAWIRGRFAVSPRRLAAFERLDRAVTDRVVADYVASERSRDAVARR